MTQITTAEAQVINEVRQKIAEIFSVVTARKVALREQYAEAMRRGSFWKADELRGAYVECDWTLDMLSQRMAKDASEYETIRSPKCG